MGKHRDDGTAGAEGPVGSRTGDPNGWDADRERKPEVKIRGRRDQVEEHPIITPKRGQY